MMMNFYKNIKIDLSKAIFIISSGLIVTLLNIFHVIIGLTKTPQNYTYMATGHYYLDYFYYLIAIVQGMNGRWLFENYLANDEPLKTFFGPWQYLIYGKFGKLFNLSAIGTYWLMTIIFTVLFCLLVYKTITLVLKKEPDYIQIVSYMIFILAGPFFKIAWRGGLKILPYEFWNDKGVVFDRFGAVPHQLLSSIITLFIIYLISSVLDNISSFSLREFFLKCLLVCLLSFFLLTFSPHPVILLFISLATSVLIFTIITNKKIWKTVFFTGIILISIIATGFLAKNYYKNIDYFRRISETESLWQVHPSIGQFLLVLGPMVLFLPFGLTNYFRQLNFAKLIVFFYGLFSCIFFLTPLAQYLGTTNTRFLTPLSYLILACLSTLGIKRLSLLFKYRKEIFIGLVIFLFLLFIPPIIYFGQGLLNDRNLFSPLTYIPNGIVQGLSYIKSLPEDKAVLTSPAQFLGTIVPIFTNKHVYLGRHYSTPNYESKAYLADRFYLKQMGDDEAARFIKKNNIGLVILTSLETYPKENIINYPFLKEIFKNSDIIILKTD